MTSSPVCSECQAPLLTTDGAFIHYHKADAKGEWELLCDVCGPAVFGRVMRGGENEPRAKEACCDPDQIAWALVEAERLLVHGEREGRAHKGLRMGVLCHRVMGRFRLSEGEAMPLCRAALKALVGSGRALHDLGAGCWYATGRLKMAGGIT